MDHRTTSRPRSLTRRHAGSWTFLREAARDFRTVGAISPSSPALARALIEPLRAQPERPLEVLEAGAGTGAVTRALISHLGPHSRLDVAEANPRFATGLQRLAATDPNLAGRRDQVRIHGRRVEELDTGRRYHLIVSGLPFANFTASQVETIMDRYLELLHPGGTLTYFAYRGTRRARSLLASRTEMLRHRAAEDVLAGYRSRYATGCRTVWTNLPPATVWQLTRPGRTVPGPARAVAGAAR